ncbi:hypothetical protein BGZ96_005298 [Linnemannia gamsii]|uniref:NTF2-domain-containing protein n=1 Tax=Linnemannia gamsii TaxID=64522 RepID=A0ABQ7K5K4_9FUNG|nr:hypothetical protein BGZ96_005298 [Linnemannia gamsii]
MTVPTASTQSPNANNTIPEIANEVGVVFAHEFYTFLNKEPSRLHCFYNRNSTMSHGYQGEQIQVFSGQQAIKEKILELDFEDCKVLVSNLDCQGSIHGGIVVQVLGEMSNRGGLAQKFVQTFFLAEQPKGYYVHNDIFRFLKDDHEEEQDEEVEEQQKEQEEEDEDLTEMYAEKADDDDDVVENPVLATGAEVVAIVPTVESKIAVTQESAATATAIVAAVPFAAPTPPKKAEPVEPVVKTETAPPGEVSQPTQPEPTPTPAPAPAPVQVPTAAPAKAKTWANLAAKNTDPWVSQAATSKAPAPAVVPVPVKPQTPTPTAASYIHHGQGQAPGHGHGHGQGQHQNQGGYVQGQGQYRRPEYHSIFIKNVNDRITEEQLREAFSKFGRIKHLDMTQKKNCAFMDFATPESVVAALKQRNVQVGHEVVLAEERRRGNHGFNNNNNNFNNGPGGPANGRGGYYGNNSVNGHQQQPQGSFRGGRGGGNSNGGVRGGGGPPDRKPTPNKPTQGVKS